ncbi:hypothetical protein SLE2022_170410 [Rubroshorea leprosula]
MTLSTAFTALLISILLATVAAPSPPHPDCVAELVAFSPCLPYVSASPNNFMATVPLQCCDAISSAFNSTGDYCFFFLLRQPVIFGFPLNVSRVLSLSPVCSVRTGYSPEPTSHSGAQELSPLPGSTNPETSKPSDSRAQELSPLPGSTNPETSKPSDTRAQELSPLSGITNPETSIPSDAVADNASSPVSISIPNPFISLPNYTERPPTPLISSGNVSFATTQIKSCAWYAPAVLILLSYIHM